MISYVILGTNFLDEGASFYDHILDLLGAKRVMEFDRGFAWTVAQDQPMVCLMTPFDGEKATISNGSMLSLVASDRETVDKMHALALDLGGANEGDPGERSEGFYAAYFRDLDGNKLCIAHVAFPETDTPSEHSQIH